MTDVQPQQPAPPATAAEASGRLEALKADKEWGAKLIAGDPAANREFSELHLKIDSVDPADMAAVAMSGNIGEMPDSRVKLMAETAGMLREIGIREEIIEQTLRGHEVSPIEMKQAEAWRERAMRDPVFVKAWLSGDPEARQKMTLSQIIVSGGVKDARGSF
jgi:hypothetical protein